MTIPKKKRRLITVNGEKYEYCITGYKYYPSEYKDFEPSEIALQGLRSIYIKSLKTGKEIKKYNFKYGEIITPRTIRDLIEKEN